MIRRPPRLTRTDTLFPYTTCFRSSPSKVTMDLIVLVLPDGRTRMASPGFTVPEPIKPDNPRKSRLGRFTHCTAMRNGRLVRRFVSNSTVARWSSNTGPLYQGVVLLVSVILSPFSPETGTGQRSEEHTYELRSRMRQQVVVLL